MKEITIRSNDEGQRLDAFMGKYLKSMPPALLYKYIRKKRIKVNGAKTQPSYRLLQGDTLQLYLNDELFESEKEEVDIYQKIRPNLSIVYEDNNILLADKPPGLIVHEDENENFNTLINHIKAYLYQKGEYNPAVEHAFAPALCNRIDRNTGGIVIASKNAQALRILNEKIKTRELHKFYLCIVMGELRQSQGELTGYLKKDAASNMVKIYTEPTRGALWAKTRYRVLRVKNGQSLIEAELITGRTHQIRAQFAAIGHPLLGDGKYGQNSENRRAGRSYQALYSYKLLFAFETPSGILSYLDGKTFEVPEVSFAKDF